MGLINPEDMDLMQVIDDPDQVLEAVLKFYEDADTAEDTGKEHPTRRDRDRDSDEDRMFYL
jgi:predicted Rossmann-fold nucleotide-binding protein